MLDHQLTLFSLNRAARTAEIKNFIVNNVESHPRDIARLVEEKFGISRQAAIKRLRQLTDEALLTATGQTRARIYGLREFLSETFRVDVRPDLAEDEVWRSRVSPLLEDLPANVYEICHHGFTEMMNNVIDHSEAVAAIVQIDRNALRTRIRVNDFGIGIFNKIQMHFGLTDARHALLELCKGKLTSDPQSHTGEGIFFTSRMFDRFSILSGKLYFTRSNSEGPDWLLEEENRDDEWDGTLVLMDIRNDAARTTKEVFDNFAAESEDYGFSKTIVPVKLAQYEGEKLISRSQAKRLVARFERFREVLLDFDGVTEIGQAFADQIFRVYSREYPSVHLYPINTTLAIRQMINRAHNNQPVEP